MIYLIVGFSGWGYLFHNFLKIDGLHPENPTIK